MPDETDDTGVSNADQPADLLSLFSPEKSTLRPEAYHGLAGEVVQILGEDSEADPIGLLIHFLTMFGNLLGDSLYVRLDSSVGSSARHPARLFSVIIGDAAMGRKGTAGSAVKYLMAEVDRRWYRRALASGLQSAEAIVSLVDDDEGDTNDLLLYYPEFGDLLWAIARRSDISERLKEAYDGEDLKVNVKSKKGKLLATKANISLMGHVTPAVLIDRFADRDISSGLASRILFASVKRSKEVPRPKPLPESQVDYLVLKIEDKLKWARKFALDATDPISAVFYELYNSNNRDREVLPKRELHLSDSALNYWDTLYARFNAKHVDVLDEFSVRAPTNIRRLALIYAVLDMSSVIDLEHIKAAEAVVDYCESSIVKVFGGISGDYYVDKVISRLYAAPNRTMTKSEIWRLLSRKRSASWINNVVKKLLATGVVEERQRPTGGRPLIEYTLIAGEKSEKSPATLNESDEDHDIKQVNSA